MNYKEQLLHPLWQKKRLEIFERDKFTCQICLDTETTLHVHHIYYDKTYQTLAWEYPPHAYKTLCSDCHEAITKHIAEYGSEDDFGVMKIKRPGFPPAVFIYTKGFLKFNIDDGKTANISEKDTKEIVHFLINNWLKNG